MEYIVITISELQEAIDAVEFHQRQRDSVRMALVRELRARGHIKNLKTEDKNEIARCLCADDNRERS